MNLKLLQILLVAFFGMLPSSNLFAGSQDLKYTYDALGRVIKVEDNLNTNRNYTYDAAGNRTKVVIGNVASSTSSSASSSHPLICATPPGAPFQCNTPNSTSYAHWAYCNDWCARNP